MSDHTDRLRKHVASYRTISRHRVNCLDVCDEVDTLQAKKEAEIDRLNDANDALIEIGHKQAKRIEELQAKVDALTAQNKTQYDRMGEQIQVNADLLKRIEELQAENKRLTMMLDEYERLDNAGKIPLEPVGGAELKGVDDVD